MEAVEGDDSMNQPYVLVDVIEANGDLARLPTGVA